MAFLKWLQDHPEQLHTHSFVLIMEALIDALPLSILYVWWNLSLSEAVSTLNPYPGFVIPFHMIDIGTS